MRQLQLRETLIEQSGESAETSRYHLPEGSHNCARACCTGKPPWAASEILVAIDFKRGSEQLTLSQSSHATAFERETRESLCTSTRESV